MSDIHGRVLFVLLVSLVTVMLSGCGGRDNSSNSISRNSSSDSTSIDNGSRGTSTDNGSNSTSDNNGNFINGSATLPPTALSYGDNEQIFAVGQTIDSLMPQSTGGSISNYESAPTLPLGLSLNSLTGIISGAPVLNKPQTTYTITGKNNAGFVTTDLLLTIRSLLSAPSGIDYRCTICSFALGKSIKSLVPSISGGQISHFSVSPALPAGLILHPTSGIISGTPTVSVSKVTFTITGRNSAGITTTGLMLTIQEAAIAQ